MSYLVAGGLRLTGLVRHAQAVTQGQSVAVNGFQVDNVPGVSTDRCHQLAVACFSRFQNAQLKQFLSKLRQLSHEFFRTGRGNIQTGIHGR